MKECPRCGVWTFEFDPHTETENCYRCGFKRKITNVTEYYIKNDVTYKLFLSSSEESVEPDKAFFFHISSDICIGEKATSLEELANKVKEIDFKSLEFHFVRGDFEKWIADVVGDLKLAEQIREMREQNRVDSTLRYRLFKTILASSIM